MDITPQSQGDFVSTGLAAPILAALNHLGMVTPTPIQARAIPVALTGKDVMGIAETGTGKTYAFALPIIEKLMKEPGKAVIMVPTRELALQVEESIRNVSKLLQLNPRTISLIGGMPIYRQQVGLRKDKPRIIICTPGRMRDHLQQKTVYLDDVKVAVLDEADRMLDMGFAPQIQAIMDHMPKERQTTCFSATMAPEVARLAAAYLKEPVRIEVAKAGKSNVLITQELAYVPQEQKPVVLNSILKDHPGSVLVFSRTKHGAGKLATYIQGLGHTAAEIHSNKSLGQRKQALSGFKTGQYRVLVATDIATRGIDVNDITLVVNYDLPDASEDYVHRIGRTGRAGKEGKAISLATRGQARDVKDIERLIGAPITISSYSTAPAPSQSYDRPRSSEPSRGFRQNSTWGNRGGSQSPRPQGQGRPFGERSGQSRPSYGDRNQQSGERPAFGGDRSNSRPSFGDRSTQPRRDFAGAVASDEPRSATEGKPGTYMKRPGGSGFNKSGGSKFGKRPSGGRPNRSR